MSLETQKDFVLKEDKKEEERLKLSLGQIPFLSVGSGRVGRSVKKKRQIEPKLLVGAWI